jgi:hypothetical protein
MDHDDPVQFFRLDLVKTFFLAGLFKFYEKEVGVVPEGAQMPFYEREELALKHVKGIGQYDSDGKGPLKNHAPGGVIGNIAGLFYEPEYLFPFSGINVFFPVYNPGNGGRGHSGLFCYILDAYHGRPATRLKL